jgi:hypothetical protein
MGKVDKTLYLLGQGDDILIFQVYVDDIVLGGLSHSLVAARIVVLSRSSDQAGEGGNLCTSSQVHEGHPQKVQDGRLEAPADTDEYYYSA